jgi:hypothetical protein
MQSRKRYGRRVVRKVRRRCRFSPKICIVGCMAGTILASLTVLLFYPSSLLSPATSTPLATLHVRSAYAASVTHLHHDAVSALPLSVPHGSCAANTPFVTYAQRIESEIAGVDTVSELPSDLLKMKSAATTVSLILRRFHSTGARTWAALVPGADHQSETARFGGGAAGVLQGGEGHDDAVPGGGQGHGEERGEFQWKGAAVGAHRRRSREPSQQKGGLVYGRRLQGVPDRNFNSVTPSALYDPPRLLFAPLERMEHSVEALLTRTTFFVSSVLAPPFCFSVCLTPL